MICKHCGRGVVKSSHSLHTNGYKHTTTPHWHCRRKGLYYDKETVEPLLFENYLKEIENEYPSS